MIGIICDFPELSGTIIKDFNLLKDDSSKIFDIYQNEDYFFINSKVGKIYASLTTQYLIDHYQPEYIINIGLITGFGNNVEIGDVIVGNHLISNQEVPTEGQHLDYFKKEMYCTAIDVQFDFDNFNVITGLCMADEEVAYDDTFAGKNKEKINAIDLQAFTVAAVCNIYSKNLIVIKGIKNKLKNEGILDEVKAMSNSIETLKKVTEHILNK